MHFGLYVNPETSGPEHDGRHIQEVIRQCELASEVGYKAIWSTEHHFMPYNTYSDCIILFDSRNSAPWSINLPKAS